MKTNKTLSIAIIVINVMGLLCLIYFAILYLTHDTFIYNPDAMLPIEVWDKAGMTLTIGFIPLLIANIFAFLYILKDKIKKPLRLLFFIPSLICLFLVISYWFI